VEDFTWSPDGSTLCFTELRGGHHGVYLVDATQGTVVRQISNGSDNDFAGKISADNNTIYFHRGEGAMSYSLWSYDRKTNLFSNYSRGMTAYPDPQNRDVIYCARYTSDKESEIWRINTKTGVEEIILSQPARSFSTPQLSPDGQWLLVTGTSMSEKDKQINTDIFAVRIDGTQFTQLTYHPGNDLSAVWAPDGRSIFFLSQRGSQDGVYNVWKMAFML
jgi:Tol biopolymer transport system component